MIEHLSWNFEVSIPVTLVALFVFSNVINCKKNVDTSFVVLLPCLAAAMVTLPVIFLLIMVFAIYRQIVRLILKAKHGANFGGLLGAYDAAHAVEDAEKNTICALFIVQHSPKTTESFYEVAQREIREKIFANPDKVPKALVVLRSYLGYGYYLKNAVKSDGFIKKLTRVAGVNKELEKRDLMKVLGDHTSDPLPNHGDALWDVYIGTQPVKWASKSSGENQASYPILLRFHHSLADGADMSRAIVRIFGDRKVITPHGLAQKWSAPNTKKLLHKVAPYVLKLGAVWLFPSILLGQVLRVSTDSSILHGPKLKSQRVLAVNVEESPGYVELVRRIRRKVPGATVVDVFLTAISASVAEFFEKNSQNGVEYISVSVPEAPKTMDLININPNHLLNQEVVCRNMTTYTLFKLPINCGGCKVNPVDRLKIIQKMGARIRNPVAFEVGHLFKMLAFGFLPQPIVNLMMAETSVTAMFTNLPGTPSMSVFNGCLVQDVVPLGYHREKTGVMFIALTYAGRLQMALSVDQVLVSDQERVQGILDGVYKYLGVLDEEAGNLQDKTC